MRKLGLRLLAGFILAAGAITAAGAEELILKNATVIDVEAGTVRPQQTLHLRNGWIERVSDDASAAPVAAVKVIDLAGKYVMPGLWDMHFHPDDQNDLDLLIANGVTSARIMFGESKHLAWRAGIELGEQQGPHLYVAGPIIEGQPPAQMAAVVDTAGRRLPRTRQEAIDEVRAEKAAGFDYLKVYNNVPADAYGGLIDEGKRLGMPVIGHVPFEMGLMGVLKAGQRTLEHLRGYVELLAAADGPVQPGIDLRSRTLAWEYADMGKAPALVQATRDAGAFICPTMAVRITTSPTADVERYLAAPDAAYMAPWQRTSLQHRERTKWLSNFSEDDWQRAARGLANQDALILAMQRAGVPLLAGTDTGPWGFTLHSELENFVKAGLTPQQALLTTTRNPAQFAGVTDHAGKIADGYQADLLILDRNPLQDVRNARAIFAVVSHGKLLDRAALDAMLAKIKARYAAKQPAAEPAH